MSIIGRSLNNAFTTRGAALGTSKLGGSFFPFLNAMGTTPVKPVNEKRALTLSAVYNAVDIISDSLAVVPFKVYEKTDEGRIRLINHPVDWLLTQEPDGENGYLNAFEFKKLIGTSLKLRGNCLFEIITANSGDMTIKYIDWCDVQDIRCSTDGVITYHIKKGTILLASEVLHFKGLSLDGIVGLSVLTYAALTLNIGIEQQHFSYTNVDNKGVSRGVIESEKVLTDSKTKIVAGYRNAMAEKSPSRVVVLDEGMKYKSISVTPQEAQLIESGRFNIEDVARWFNVPLYKLKSLTQSTNNNVEQMSLDFVSDTMQPIVTSIEEEINRKMLTRSERKTGRYIVGNMNVLVRTDMKTKKEFYTGMVNSGIYAANEIRAKEDLNSLPGGDELRFPVNTQTQEEIDKKLEENGK
ncbi:phage portal protein [uncultured Flavobacterium sp.]|uniref:phage portal protein n=1 Tax=uncultured Flavobacterium sp. TaxID=165435 RepID=UPI0025CDD34F|nr:phage portal protein [uncultured Flavobacterium sp.]